MHLPSCLRYIWCICIAITSIILQGKVILMPLEGREGEKEGEGGRKGC